MISATSWQRHWQTAWLRRLLRSCTRSLAVNGEGLADESRSTPIPVAVWHCMLCEKIMEHSKPCGRMVMHALHKDQGVRQALWLCGTACSAKRSWSTVSLVPAWYCMLCKKIKEYAKPCGRVVLHALRKDQGVRQALWLRGTACSAKRSRSTPSPVAAWYCMLCNRIM